MSTLYVDNLAPNLGSGVLIPGHVVQVQSNSVATQFNTTSSSLVTTGVSASITPLSASSKIYFSVACGDTATDNPNSGVSVAVYRNGSIIDEFLARHSYVDTSASESLVINGASFSYLDSPATTSALTYTIYISNGGAGTATIMRDNTRASITLMEIAQ